MKKIGGSHVGMILSFLIFITFLAFLYSVLQPATQMEQDKMDLLNYLETELLTEFSEDITTVIVNVSDEIIGNCVEFNNFDSSLNELGAIAKIIKIENNLESESKTDSGIEDNKIQINEATKKIKFYYSKEFNSTYGSVCSSPILINERQDYSIALFRTTEDIFESKIKNISQEMVNSIYYDLIKQRLGLSLNDEFGFIFENETRGEIARANIKEVNTNIYSDEVPIQYIDEEANIKPGFIIVRVW